MALHKARVEGGRAHGGGTSGGGKDLGAAQVCQTRDSRCKGNLHAPRRKRGDDATELNGRQTTGGLEARPRAFPEIMGSHRRDIRALKC